MARRIKVLLSEPAFTEPDYPMRNPNARPIRVMLVNDLQIVMWGLEKLVLGHGPRIELAGSAVDAVAATKLIYETPVDVILVDLDGDIRVDSIAELCAISPARVLALTASRDVSLHDSAILAGARGVVAKGEPVEALLKAFEKVHEGEFWIDRAATSRIFLHLAQRTKAEFETPDQLRIASLTRRERQTVAEIAKDASANGRVIAQRLEISENTLRNHLNSIYAKLGLSSRLELFAFAKLHMVTASA
jgi:two-component system nitrate/nitrite response regulator NarL